MKEKNGVCEILFSCLIVLSTDVLVSLIYKTHATIFQFGYIYRLFLGAFVSIFPIYVAAKNYKSIVARSMKPWSIGILIITTLIPLFFSDVDFERKVYVYTMCFWSRCRKSSFFEFICLNDLAKSS